MNWNTAIHSLPSPASGTLLTKPFLLLYVRCMNEVREQWIWTFHFERLFFVCCCLWFVCLSKVFVTRASPYFDIHPHTAYNIYTFWTLFLTTNIKLYLNWRRRFRLFTLSHADTKPIWDIRMNIVNTKQHELKREQKSESVGMELKKRRMIVFSCFIKTIRFYLLIVHSLSLRLSACAIRYTATLSRSQPRDEHEQHNTNFCFGYIQYNMCCSSGK